jgi:cytoskeletal protein CcmA (bactofilin family)
MGTYVNNLRLLEITTGDESGTWGTKTNTNLELIADAFGSGTEAITTNADTHTTTIADGAADEGRAIFLKYTGTLDSACTITIAPNTVNKLWFIENATSGSQNIIISQGSGANITIGNGKVAAVFTDGAGSGAAVLDAFADLELSSTLTVAGNVDFNGDLDVDGTTNLDVVDIDGAVDMATTLTLAGNADFNGDLDVDGTTNLDVVDIDGAVDMATTLTLAGNADFNGDLDVDGTTNLDVVDIDGAVDMASTLTLGGTLTVNAGAVFNEASADVDFRIEGNGDANLFRADAGNDHIGIGVSAPHAKLTVKDAQDISMDSSGSGQLAITGNGYTGAIALDSGYMNIYHNAASIGIAFGTNEQGRMYIDSAGIVTIGRTSGQAFTVDGHQFYQSGAYYNAHAAGEVVRWYESGSGNDVGSIDTTSSNTAYNTSSDRRLKENIETADSSGSLIDDIEIVKHDWIASDDYVRYGVIAQDLFEVVPEAVSRGTDGDFVEEDLSGDEMPTKQVWGVDYSKLVPLLVKEVQELRARVSELES